MEEKENSDGRQGEEAQGQMGSKFKKERERERLSLGFRGEGKWKGCWKIRNLCSFALCCASSHISYSASLFTKASLEH